MSFAKKARVAAASRQNPVLPMIEIGETTEVIARRYLDLGLSVTEGRGNFWHPPNSYGLCRKKQGDCMPYIALYRSPLGGMTLASDGEKLTGLWFDGQKYFPARLADACEEKDLPVFGQTKKWLDIYFSGQAPDFTPPLSPDGASPFRRRVWEILLTIPFGQTSTYGKIAERIAAETGKKVSAQAVGGAVGHNPVSLIVPCHRVVGSDGSPTGYAGGLDKKIALLKREGAQIRQ